MMLVRIHWFIHTLMRTYWSATRYAVHEPNSCCRQHLRLLRSPKARLHAEQRMTADERTLEASGGQAWVRRFEGVVLHADRREEMQVTAVGGGGMVGPRGGYVAPPQVESTSVQHQTVFVRDDRGREESFELQDWNVPVRPGSRLAIVWGSRLGNERGSFLAVRNIDTGDERWRDIRTWARGQRLLAGSMLFWPSALAALVLGLSFMAMASFARTRALSLGGPNFSSDLALASAIAFVPAFVVEWLVMVSFRVGDDEHLRIEAALKGFLRSGKMQ